MQMHVSPRVILGILVILAVAGTVIAVVTNPQPAGHSSVVERSQAAQVTPEETAPFTSFRDGTFKAGTDIKVGTYSTDGVSHDGLSDYCYWARATSDSGDMGSLIAHDFNSGPDQVTIKPGETFRTSGGCDWKLVG